MSEKQDFATTNEQPPPVKRRKVYGFAEDPDPNVGGLSDGSDDDDGGYLSDGTEEGDAGYFPEGSVESAGK